MNSDWPELQFPEAVDFKEGPGIMARDFREKGVPLIRVAGLSGSASVLNGCNYLDPDKVAAKWSQFKLLACDTLLSTSASLGRVAVAGPEAEGAIPYTGIIRMRPRDSRVEPSFIPYLLRGPHFQRQAEAMGSGSVLKHFGPSHLKQITVILPPVEHQRRIAWVLGSLGDKIDSNRRLAALLEETAAALFRARFVDFVGVEEFEESEIGPIPRGWTIGALGEVVDVTMGQSPPGSSYSEDPEDGLLLVQGRGGFGERYPRSEVYTSAATRRAQSGATLMTVRAPVGAVNVARTDVCLGRGVAGTESEHHAFAEFLIRSLSSRWGSEESGTIFPAVNQKQIVSLQVAVPPRKVVVEFEQLASPMVTKLAALHDERELLAAIRDALLPKLVSGEIRVPDTPDPDAVIAPPVEHVAA